MTIIATDLYLFNETIISSDPDTSQDWNAEEIVGHFSIIMEAIVAEHCSG